MRTVLLYCIISLVSTSCFVQQPEYADYNEVMELQTGYSYTQLKDSLRVEPYYIKEDVLDSFKVYVYKYRASEIKRIRFLQKRNRGLETEGDYLDLLVTVSNHGKVVRLETIENFQDAEQNTTVIDFDSLIRGITTMITVSLPAFLVFLSNGS